MTNGISINASAEILLVFSCHTRFSDIRISYLNQNGNINFIQSFQGLDIISHDLLLDYAENNMLHHNLKFKFDKFKIYKE